MLALWARLSEICRPVRKRQDSQSLAIPYRSVKTAEERWPVHHANRDTEEVARLGSIPPSLAPCFQEYDLGLIDPEQHADLVIERVLFHGDRRELQWLFRRYGRGAVTEWVRRSGAQRLSRRRYNLWCVLLDVPTRRSRFSGRQIWPY